jgi:hypothetical protein
VLTTFDGQRIAHTEVQFDADVQATFDATRIAPGNVEFSGTVSTVFDGAGATFGGEIVMSAYCGTVFTGRKILPVLDRANIPRKGGVVG